MRTAVKALIKLRVRTHTHTEILLTVVETLLCIVSFCQFFLKKYVFALFYSDISAEMAADVFKTSGLSSDVLADVWDVSDVTRDGHLSLDEFCVACHLLRFCRKQGAHMQS